MNPVQSIITCIIKVKSTSGRAKRSEFWWFALFVLLYSVLSNSCLEEYEFTHPIFIITMITSAIINTGLSSAITRRLHDIGKSGWSQLIILTIVGIPMFIYWLTFPSEKSDNQYGSYDIDNDTRQSSQETLSDAEILSNYNNDFFESQKQKPLENRIPLLIKKTHNTQHIHAFGKRSRSVTYRR
jgi:uncharacterized membrane protein YhaH (DUF805 family)